MTTCFFFSSRRRHTRYWRDWSSDVCSSDLGLDTGHPEFVGRVARTFDTLAGGADVTDTLGHGTVVTGLIAAVDGNGKNGRAACWGRGVNSVGAVHFKKKNTNYR